MFATRGCQHNCGYRGPVPQCATLPNRVWMLGLLAVFAGNVPSDIQVANQPVQVIGMKPA